MATGDPLVIDPNTSGFDYLALVDLLEGAATAYVMVVHAGEQDGIYTDLSIETDQGPGTAPPDAGAPPHPPPDASAPDAGAGDEPLANADSGEAVTGWFCDLPASAGGPGAAPSSLSRPSSSHAAVAMGADPLASTSANRRWPITRSPGVLSLGSPLSKGRGLGARGCSCRERRGRRGSYSLVFSMSALLAELSAALDMLLDHRDLILWDSEVVAAALEPFRARPAVGFSGLPDPRGGEEGGGTYHWGRSTGT